MATIEQRKAQLEDVQTVHFISGALVEVSAARMQQLKSDLAKNVGYYEEIGALYGALKLAAVARDELPRKAPSRKVDIVSVAFTSNRRFYGAVNRNLISNFVRGVSKLRTDCIVIGKTGRSVVEAMKEKPRCTFHAFKADQPTRSEMKAFLKKVHAYKKVIIYYPRFQSVFSQNTAVLDITHTPPRAKIESSIEYIFEPELPQILTFFEGRVRFLLFQRAMLETELARTAARFVAMSGAEQQSDATIKKLRSFITALENSLVNRQLLESLMGFSKFAQWKHHQ